MVNYPKDWNEKKLGDIVKIRKGSQIHGSNTKTLGEYPHINGGVEPSGYVDEWNELENTITVSEGGNSCGYVNYQNSKFWAGGHCYAVEPNTSTINTEYLYFVLKHNQNNIMRLRVGSGLPNIQSKRLLDFRITIEPNIKEQKAIADTLMTFDKHIENLEKLITKKKMIRDGAVEDLMSGKTRLDGFDGEWENIQFERVITPKARIGWQDLKKDEYLKKGFAYLISGTDFESGSISLNEISYVNKERYNMDANIQVKEGDVLVTKDGTIGKIARVPKLDKKATLNSGVFVFRTNHLLEDCFLYWILRSSIFEKFIDDLSAGSTIKHLYQKDLKNFSFLMPIDINEQKAIANILTVMDEEIEDLRQEKEKIEKIKDGAMDDLLTGRIRLVKEA